MIQYILECIAFQLVFLIIYDFFLKRETFFQWNRLYLMGTYVLSIVLPWVKIEALKTTVPEQYYTYPEFLWNADAISATVTSTEAPSFHLSWEDGILYGGMLVAAIYFGYKLFQIYKLRNAGTVQRFPNFTQIVVKNSELAFSFFKSIFLGDKVIQREHQNIIQHELVHIEQRHSWDLLFFELMRIIGWFNPLVYVYQSRVSELHEFIADSKVAKTDKKEQYEFLLSQIFQTENISFVNQFFKTSLIKKRIAMLQRTKSKKVWQLKYLLLLPLVLGMLLYTSSEAQEKETVDQEQTSDDKALIDRLNAKIDSEIEQSGSLEKVFREFSKKHGIYYSQDYVMSKDIYFESRLISDRHFAKYVDSLKKAKTLFFRKKSFPKRPLPSTARYKSYVARTKAFQILDDNLRISISANRNNEGFGVRPIALKNNNPGGHFVFEVENIKDLTGEEVRAFNNKLDAIFERNYAEYSGLILTDGDYTFEIFETQPFDDLKESQDNTKLSIEKSASIDRYNQLVAERKRLIKSSNEKNPVIVNLDQQIQGLKQSIDGQSNVNTNSMDDLTVKYKQLLAERNRLLQSSNERNPVIVNLDQQIQGLKQSIDGQSNVNMNSRGDLTAKYNQLLVERKRLLKSSDESNPVIVNLDQQLAGLRKAAFGDGETVPFNVVEEVPVFPGCESEGDKRACFQNKIQRHISKNFRYPEEAQQKGIQGRVAIMFTISETGTIYNVSTRGPHQSLEDEAERIISRLPQMFPGKHKSKLVNVAYSIPITFKLEDNGITFRTRLNLDTTNENLPLFMLDGEESTKEVIDNIDPNDIASIDVLKDESAIKKYGEKGRNGVLEIFTKNNNNVVSALSNTDAEKILKFRGDNSEFPLMSNDGAAPLIILDGKESSKEKMNFIAPEDIESINVWKDEAAMNLYGEKGKNGVVVVFTKKGGKAAKEANEIYKADTSTMSVTAIAKDKNGSKLISGTVTEGTMGLPGATIGIEGSERGVISDFDGNFSIRAKKGDIIIFQYIGLPILKLTITDEENYQITKKK